MNYRIKHRDLDCLHGHFSIRVYRRGRLIEAYEDHNLIVNGAKAAMTHLIAGAGTGKNINRIALGTNGASLNTNNTTITSPFIKTISGILYPQTNQVEFDWALSTTEANGKAISEFGLLCADGTLFARKTRVKPLNKENDIAIEGQWIIIF
jgi:hypothetical protein